MNTKPCKLLILTTLLLANGIAQAAINLGINPIAQSGNSVDIGIVISGLESGVAPSLSTYDLDLNFDQSQLSFASAVFGDPVLGNQLDLFNFGSNLVSAGITSPGVLNLYELSFDSAADLNALQADSFTLAVISFDVLNVGSSHLELVINALGDADGNVLLADVSSATITTVPLPPAFLMMFSGLFAVLVSRRNRLNQMMITNQN